ncbi:threonine synthase [Verrucomicrobiota bacterium]
MRYISTRGGMEPVSFSEAVMTGLAPDGGLLLPERIPDATAELDRWKGLSYPELAAEIVARYADLPVEDIRRLVRKSYQCFSTPEVAPVVRVKAIHVLELFHGPTLAFKDVALQLLGNLFEYLLSASGRKLNILAATSGDTGSAAICGVRGRERINIFVMHPHGRISRIQELQMTSVTDPNVFNLGVEGTFDDCQGILKAVFRDLDFKQEYGLGAVNSINWARVLAQIVYYFYGAFRVMDSTGASRVRFCVPTGNFGNIFAGYLAARMGLPVGALVLATNENDILSRYFSTGVYSLGEVVPTVSPSMDIQVASNFERYLYYRLGEDPAALRELMDTFAKSGRIETGPDEDCLFVSGAGDTRATLSTIAEVHRDSGYLLDPHSAVAFYVAGQHLRPDEPMISLATAHPAKFDQAIREATGDDLARHPALDELENRPTRLDIVPASESAVREYIVSHVAPVERVRAEAGFATP